MGLSQKHVGFAGDMLGRPNVQAVGETCHEIKPMIAMHEHPRPIPTHMGIGDVVFLCVDSLQTRQHIWHAVKDRVDFLADGRTIAEIVRVLAAADQLSRDHDPTTLFHAEEAVQGTSTAKSTIFTASIAAGLMLEQFTQWLRRMPDDADLQPNLLTSELAVV